MTVRLSVRKLKIVVFSSADPSQELHGSVLLTDTAGHEVGRLPGARVVALEDGVARPVLARQSEAVVAEETARRLVHRRRAPLRQRAQQKPVARLHQRTAGVRCREQEHAQFASNRQELANRT